MARLKLDPETIGLTTILENHSHVKVKDCFRDDNTIYYVVGEGELGRAIGKAGIHVKNVQQQLQKKIRIIEHSDDIERFVRNIVSPLQVENISICGSDIILHDSSRKTKSLLIGRQGHNLELLNRAVRRFFSFNVKVDQTTK